MREIIFRGKYVNSGGWLFGDLQQNCDVVKIREQESDTKRVPRSFTVDPETVGQYTGLTDKNGRKIFEGDVVKGIDEYMSIPVFGKVGFGDGSFYAVDKYGLSHYRWADYYDMKVIGNIYDNPELLEGGANQ